MRVFSCHGCQNLIFFENFQCVSCGRALGFLPEVGRLEALELSGDGLWYSPRYPGPSYRRCQDRHCNWMLETTDPNSLCRSCRLTRTLPDLSLHFNQERRNRLEAAKRRWLYSILSLGLPCQDRLVDPIEGLAFDFLAPETGPVITGHAGGIITMNAAEADDPIREWARVNLNESYRTLLGHFRHESGHYYWDVLIAGRPWLDEFRALFGDEQLVPYEQALARHHCEGPPVDWLERGFISAYASCHPWEDWAETWAHYLHLIDTLESARSFGLQAHRLGSLPNPRQDEFGALLADWIPLTLALNSLNRSMGLPDLYPFVLSAPAMDKLAFVHQVVGECTRPLWTDSAEHRSLL